MSETGAAADLVATIVAATRRTVESRAELEPLDALGRRADAAKPIRGRFRSALALPDRVNVIAECKRRSPSKGVLRSSYDAAAIARAYHAGGAAAISVLTEPSFFDGSLADLAAVRAAVPLPVLRKDFVVTDYQLFEARATGADAVLLIVAALSPAELAKLHRQAHELDLDVLVEVHSADELAIALDVGADIIGVNNRNLRTLAVDAGVSETLAPLMPKTAVAVSESGLRTAADLTRLRALGFSAFLIGERFMTEADPGQALASLIESAVHPDRAVVQPSGDSR
jgi:indole-3-glycerol phosphate synthase